MWISRGLRRMYWILLLYNKTHHTHAHSTSMRPFLYISWIKGSIWKCIHCVVLVWRLRTWVFSRFNALQLVVKYISVCHHVYVHVHSSAEQLCSLRNRWGKCEQGCCWPGQAQWPVRTEYEYAIQRQVAPYFCSILYFYWMYKQFTLDMWYTSNISSTYQTWCPFWPVKISSSLITEAWRASRINFL